MSPLSTNLGTALGAGSEILVPGSGPAVAAGVDALSSSQNSSSAASSPTWLDQQISGLFTGELIARIATGFLGFLLIAAAIFTHPTVIQVGKKVGKAAAEAGAAAA